jgi:hypothetical protein
MQKEEQAAIAYKLLLIIWIKSVHAEIEVPGSHLRGFCLADRNSTAMCRTLHIPHILLKVADVASGPLPD